MKFLVIGLGSMGKRRIRNLQALGMQQIYGFDVRADRTQEAARLYNIKVFDAFDTAVAECKPDVFIISTSPDYHMQYAFYALGKNIHCFIEASVMDKAKIYELHEKSQDSELIFAPSCTMWYYPGPQKIRELFEQRVIGRVLNINYHVGQYLPDWHPWEDIREYYVSKKQMGGCKEIVPFELTWLNTFLGQPQALACVLKKLSDMPTDIDDIYHCLLAYKNNPYSPQLLANITIDVLARPCAIREMRVIGSHGQLIWSGEENAVRYIHNDIKEWKKFPLQNGTVENQYINPEEPYIAELSDFIAACETHDKNKFPNNLLADYHILKLLNDLEQIGVCHE